MHYLLPAEIPHIQLYSRPLLAFPAFTCNPPVPDIYPLGLQLSRVIIVIDKPLN